MLEQIQVFKKLEGQLDMALFYSIRITEGQVWLQGKLTTSTYNKLKDLGYQFEIAEDHCFLQAMTENEDGKIFITLTPPL